MVEFSRELDVKICFGFSAEIFSDSTTYATMQATVCLLSHMQWVNIKIPWQNVHLCEYFVVSWLFFLLKCFLGSRPSNKQINTLMFEKDFRRQLNVSSVCQNKRIKLFSFRNFWSFKTSFTVLEYRKIRTDFVLHTFLEFGWPFSYIFQLQTRLARHGLLVVLLTAHLTNKKVEEPWRLW